MNAPNVFKPGKLTFVLDSGAGSSSKGLRAAHTWKNYKQPHTKFAVNTFMSNAAHTIIDESGNEYVYQCLSSITHMNEAYEKQYISPGCVFSFKEVWGEITKYNLTPQKLGIHPHAVIVSQIDIDYESGKCDFEGNLKEKQDSANLRIGSTLHGVGSARARRILRRDDVKLAKDIHELQSFICQTDKEIINRLNNGESGLMEIAQGYQLSLMGPFFPRTTSRNCSVAAALDDSLIPPVYAGQTVVNFRTCPIRVNNNKYVRKSDKKVLTFAEFSTADKNDKEVIKGDSGGMYADQTELTWEEISKQAGEGILEMTSLTKLPRRVFTFSKENFRDGILHNNTGEGVFLSINFMNYIDASVKGKTTVDGVLTTKIMNWLKENVFCEENIQFLNKYKIEVKGLFLGTWKGIDDSIFISQEHCVKCLDYICRR